MLDEKKNPIALEATGYLDPHDSQNYDHTGTGCHCDDHRKRGPTQRIFNSTAAGRDSNTGHLLLQRTVLNSGNIIQVELFISGCHCDSRKRGPTFESGSWYTGMSLSVSDGKRGSRSITPITGCYHTNERGPTLIF